MKCAVFILCWLVYSLPAWGQVRIPGKDEGYDIKDANSSHQDAPSSYEGRTDYDSQTAVGNKPETTGKTIKSHFTFGNQVKTCPDADGTVEGTGVFSISVDYSDTKSNTQQHFEVKANAKYKGQVADNAMLEGPVMAEVDYSYTLSGGTRESNGLMTTPSAFNVPQHISLPVLVSPKMMGAPDFGAFSGGDPTKGHYAEALITAEMLSYWGGVYFSIAESKWLQGQCADVIFSPPSYTLQPPLGAQATVKAEVKTKAGAITRGFFEVEVLPGSGSVEAIGGRSDVGYPIKFTYTAPVNKVANAGFRVKATSRAGAAAGEWKTGLGTGWSGQISCTQTWSGDAGGDKAQSWSNYQVTRLTITVKDGVGTGTGYFEQKNMASNRRPVANYADPKNPSYVDDGSSSSEGSALGESKGTVEVTLNKSNGTYSINPSLTPASPAAMGQLRSTVCIPNRGCTEHDSPLGMPACLPGLGGEFSDPNQLQGELKDHKTGLGRIHNGTYTYEANWNLARSGSK
jgi:hypothetical protein